MANWPYDNILADGDSSGTATVKTFEIPAHSAGDPLLVIVGHNGTITSVVDNAGDAWTEAYQNFHYAPAFRERHALFYKIADGTETTVTASSGSNIDTGYTLRLKSRGGLSHAGGFLDQAPVAKSNPTNNVPSITLPTPTLNSVAVNTEIVLAVASNFVAPMPTSTYSGESGLAHWDNGNLNDNGAFVWAHRISGTPTGATLTNTGEEIEGVHVLYARLVYPDDGGWVVGGSTAGVAF